VFRRWWTDVLTPSSVPANVRYGGLLFYVDILDTLIMTLLPLNTIQELYSSCFFLAKKRT
jgi:hypothetical protein